MDVRRDCFGYHVGNKLPTLRFAQFGLIIHAPYVSHNLCVTLTITRFPQLSHNIHAPHDLYLSLQKSAGVCDNMRITTTGP